MSSLPHISVRLKRLNGKAYIALAFNYNSEFIELIRQIPTAQWYAQDKIWLVDNNTINLKQMRQTFSSIAQLDESSYFRRKGRLSSQLNSEQKSILNGFHNYLKGKRYSKSTIRTYVFAVAEFILYHSSKTIAELDNRAVELFIEAVYIKRKYSISTQRQFISALKLFVIYEPSTSIDELELVRPNKSRKLPVVLSQEEVIAIIAISRNLKHRVIIALLYSSGLRIGELLQLKIKDINIERRQLFIQNSKGRKDRYVALAESILPLLKNYFMTYRPLHYVVEGQSGKQYSASSVRKFLKKYVFQCGIRTHVTPHTLRHSYATHLLENGVGIRHIQELLGHSKPETTMIYTHLARKDLLDIRSPLDTAIAALAKSDKNEQNFLLSGN